MKLISWNVNGLRACLKKGFLDFCDFANADVICLQETKMRPEQAEFDLPGYYRYWNSADKAGYSGTAIFTRQEPLSVIYDFGIDEHRHEGRVITAGNALDDILPPMRRFGSGARHGEIREKSVEAIRKIVEEYCGLLALPNGVAGF